MSRSSSNDIKQKECPICCNVKSEFRCMVLINCRHTVCRTCLRSSITYCRSSGLRCPVADCDQLLEEAEMRDIVGNTRPNIELAPVANHWNWSSKSKEKTYSRIAKNVEYSSFFRKEEYPKLPSSTSAISKDTSNVRTNTCRNVMDEPVPGGSKSYESFKSSKKTAIGGWLSEKHTDGKDWDPTSKDRLRQLIVDKMHKVVDFVFVASKDDISFNMDPTDCLICQDHIKTYEGVSFPYCSNYFCQSCVTQPGSRVNHVIILYSDSGIKSKNCAVIINGDMIDFLEKACPVSTKTVRSLVSIYENDNVGHLPYDGNKKLQECSSGYTPSTSLDTKSNKSYENTSHMDSISDIVLLRNIKPSSCEFCNKQIGAKKGVILRNCYHVLCESCLINTIMVTLDTTTGVEVRCPMVLDNHRRCETIVQEREIKSLLSEKQYGVYEKKCLEAAEDEFSTRVHCLKSTCTGWIVIEGYKESFVCPVCSSINCLSCKAIHPGKICSIYQLEIEQKAHKDLSLKAKLMALDTQKNRCPSCRGDRLKPPRCNFIRCIDCDTVFSLPTPESKK